MTPTEVQNERSDGLAIGQRLRDRGLSIAEDRQKRLARRGGRTVVKLALERPRFTADDLQDELQLRDHVRHAWIGAIFRAVVVAGVIERCGAEPSRRPANHARLQSIWRLADRAAAERWLADHPELPDPPAPNLFDGLDDWGSA